MKIKLYIFFILCQLYCFAGIPVAVKNGGIKKSENFNGRSNALPGEGRGSITSGSTRRNRDSIVFNIEIWNGNRHQIGQLGESQNDFNLLGHINSRYQIVSLIYSLNGGSAYPLRIKNFRRIVRDNDFNADIPISSMRVGENIIVLKAVDINRDSAKATVSIIRRKNGHYPFPVIIRWARVSNAEDVGQITDGKWTVSPEGLRTEEIGYDRVFLIGNKAWKDYEVSCKVTIHKLSEKNGPESWTVHHAGFCFRWSGHSPEENQPGDQPKWGLHPRGGIIWLTFKEGRFPPLRQFYPGDSEDVQSFAPFIITLGKPFWMKGKCETLPDSAAGFGVTKYSFKVWNTGAKEPPGWDFEVVQTSATALRTGGLALVAHETDATFGDIHIRSLEK